MTSEEYAAEQDAATHTPEPRTARREPTWVLVLGILLFLVLQILSWWDAFDREPSVSFEDMETARINTFVVTFFQYQQLGDAEHLASLFGPATEAMAEQGAESWETVSRTSEDRPYRAKVLVNAAVLHGVIDDDAAARKNLQRAAQLDPAQAASYETLARLYQDPPQPVTFTPELNRLTADLSSVWLLRSQNAQVQGDEDAARRALAPGARAGGRVVLVFTVLVQFFLVLFITAIVLWGVLRAQLGQLFRDITQPAPSATPWGIGSALIIISAVYLLTQVINVILVAILHPGPDDMAAMLPISASSTIISTLAVLGTVLTLQGKKPWEWALFGWRKTRQGLWYGVAALLLSYPIIWFATLISTTLLRDYVEAHPLVPALQAAREPWVVVTLVLMAVVMAPLVEETLFRGILFRAMGDRMRFWPAALLSAFLFSIGHAQIVAILPIAVIGTLFAVLTRRTGSLIAPAAAHAAFNGISTAVALLLAWAMRV